MLKFTPLIIIITIMFTMRLSRAFGPRIIQGSRSRQFSPLTSAHRLISTTRMVMAKDELDMEIDNMIENIVMEEVPPPSLTNIETEVSLSTHTTAPLDRAFRIHLQNIRRSTNYTIQHPIYALLYPQRHITTNITASFTSSLGKNKR